MLFEGFTKNESYKWYDEYSDSEIAGVDNRYIQMNSASNPSVCNDSRSQLMMFQLGRMQDGFDLNKAKLRIEFRNQNKEVGTNECCNVQYNDEFIYVGWLPDEYATSVPGVLEFQIVGVGSNSHGESYEWRSLICKDINVYDSVKNGKPVELSGSWQLKITEIEKNVAKLDSRISSAIGNLKNPDAEILDGRVGYDSTQYACVGDAIRSAQEAASKASGIDDDNVSKETTYSSKKIEDTVKNVGKYIKFASEEEARAGEDKTKLMTPYTVAAAIDEMGGGGGGSFAIPTMTSSFEGGSFSLNETIEIRYRWGSPNSGNGTLHVLVDSIEFQTSEVSQGVNKYALTGLSKGSHSIQMYVIDRAGEYTDTLKFTIKVGTLDITSTFDDSTDFGVTQIIKIPITVDTISLEPIYMNRTIDNETVTLLAENGYNVFTLPTLSAGAHKVSFQATSSVYTSNILSYDIIIEDTENLTLISDFNQTLATYRELLEIAYRVSLKGVSKFSASYYIDGEKVRDLTVPSGTNIWSTRDLSIGQHDLKVVVSTTDGEKTAELSWAIIVKSSDYTPMDPVKDASLLCWYDATNKSNLDNDRDSWEDKSGNNTPVKLYNLNYGSNGWINGALYLNGGAYAEIDLQPLKNNAPYGMTVDIKFRTRDVGNQDACVLDMRGNDSNGKGFAIDTDKMYLNSATGKISSTVQQETISRATFVIDRETKTARIYNNGVLTEAFIMDTSEDFYNTQKILLGATNALLDGTYQPAIFGDCEIFSIRVYDRNLTGEEVVQNLIADIADLEEQEEKYNQNYKNTMPTMYFYGDTSAMTKDTKVPLRIKYISTDATKYGESFDLPDCSVSWQGTSSLQYAVKNYKIRLRNQGGAKYKYTPFKNGILESTFCLKADYMESSHANNTGTAKFIGEQLYDEKTPAQKLNDKTRTTIDGFPIQLYIAKDSVSTPVYMGIFNFNLDKSCTDTLGLDNSISGFEKCCRFEVSSNSDTSAGAFRDDSDSSIREDFELAYPDEDDLDEPGISERYSLLKRIVSWVKNSTEETFKAELEQYFNKEYLIKYFLLAHWLGMVDNLGKNMMLCTWDGSIWYPTFYDMDTMQGLDNTGYLEFQSDCDIVEGVYNTSNSKLFVMLQTCFKNDITEAYKELRRNNRFSLETYMNYWYGQQVSQIGELQYNLDMEAKYIKFRNDYLFMLHGRRYEDAQKWIEERTLYLDTIYGYEADTSASITIRANTASTVNIDILTYSPQYLRVKWRNGIEQKLKIGRDASGKMVPTTFSGTLATATDQEVIIYNAKQIKRIDNLKSLNPSVLNLVEAKKLTELVCPGSSVLADVRLSQENTFIGKVDLRGCSVLTGSIDLSGMHGLREVRCQGTKLENIIFPQTGCNVKEIFYPETIKSIVLKEMPMLERIFVADINNKSVNNIMYKKIIANTIEIVNCNKLKMSSFFLNSVEKSDVNVATEHAMNKQNLCMSAETISIKNSLVDDMDGEKTFYIGSCTESSSGAGSKYWYINDKMFDVKKMEISDCDFGKHHIACMFGTPINNQPMCQSLSIKNCKMKSLSLWRLGFVEETDLDLTGNSFENFQLGSYANVKNLYLPDGIKALSIEETVPVKALYYYANHSIDNFGFESGFKYAGEFPTELQNINLYVKDKNGSDVVNTTESSIDLSQIEFRNALVLGSAFNKFGTIKVNVRGDLQDEKGSYSTHISKTNGKYFKLPVTSYVEGKIVSTDTIRTWCVGTNNEYPPMENFDNLEWDMSRMTDFSDLFNHWKNLKKLPDGIVELICANAIKATNAFANLTGLEDISELDGKDLNFQKATNISSLIAGITIVFSIGDVICPKVTTADGARSALKSNGLRHIGNVRYENIETSDSLFAYIQKIETIESVELPKSNDVRYLFNSCNALQSIGKFSFSTIDNALNIFANCIKLSHCIFDGKIQTLTNSGIEKCPLDAESVASLVNCLTQQSSATTVKLHATAYANLTPELIALATSKNWTLASA